MDNDPTKDGAGALLRSLFKEQSRITFSKLREQSK
jgi:hypothetical protein